MTIATENAKIIRRPYDLYVGFSSNNLNVNVSLQSTANAAAKDSNISTSIDADWVMRDVADLQGEGFALMPTTEWYSAGSASEERGKLGLRSHIGGTMTLTVRTSATSEAVTLQIHRGSGTATANGNTYTLVPQTVIPMTGNTVTIVITSDNPEERVEISGISAGVSLEFDNTNIISCVLDLRSDLSREAPTWQESGIDLQAYYPNDIEAVISNMPEDTPIYYYCGYPSDLAPRRDFYLTGTVTQENGVITLSGVDASHKLDTFEMDDTVFMMPATRTRQLLYSQFASFILHAGIKLRSREEIPPAHGRSTNTQPFVMFRQTAREYTARVMNLCHVPAAGDYDPFWPTFVDAGIPTVYWSKPTAKWTIYENMTADHQRGFERKFSKIVTTDVEGLTSTLHKRAKRSTIAETDCEKGEIYTQSFDGYFIDVTVTNASVISSSATEITFKAKKNGQCKVTGYKIYVSNAVKRINLNQKGAVWQEDTPSTVGRLYTANNDRTLNPLFPAYATAARRSNIVGSFTFRGDPRMQPRDVFIFRRLDGTSETCTIESIMLTHEGGGTTSTITYRRGIC